jgi:hypothetical protein
MLACHPIQSFGEEPKSLTSESLTDTIGESSDASLPAIYPMGVNGESDCSRSNASSLDFPLDAHVLPGRGNNRTAVLPFFCIADTNNIVDLMSTVACQRHVWGILQPVISFALSESGVVATLVLSWVDPATVSLRQTIFPFPHRIFSALFTSLAPPRTLPRTSPSRSEYSI